MDLICHFVAQSLETHEVWIPLEAAIPGSDPRGNVLPTVNCPIEKFLLALPPFALLPPKDQEAAESSGFSWSEDPPGNTHDDASSVGESNGVWPLPFMPRIAPAGQNQRWETQVMLGSLA
jgi:hypothetical protein